LITGGPLPDGLWINNQPDDNDGVEDGEEDFAYLESNSFLTGLQDAKSIQMHGLICECEPAP